MIKEPLGLARLALVLSQHEVTGPTCTRHPVRHVALQTSYWHKDDLKSETSPDYGSD